MVTTCNYLIGLPLPRLTDTKRDEKVTKYRDADARPNQVRIPPQVDRF